MDHLRAFRRKIHGYPRNLLQIGKECRLYHNGSSLPVQFLLSSLCYKIRGKDNSDCSMLRNKSILFVIFVFMKKVLVIDNYDSFVYNVIQLLREAVVPVGYDIVRNDKLIEFCKYTHPILGICLGHQAIAETFGASLYNLSRPLHGHRSVLKKVDEHDPLFEDLADPIQVGRYHSWVIDPETMPGELITSSIWNNQELVENGPVKVSCRSCCLLYLIRG